MQPPVVTAFYAGIFALLMVWLSLQVIAVRRRAGAAFGDGGDPALMRAIRAHGNAAETVPMGLLLIALAEMLAAPPWLAHAMALTLLTGRAAHAWHFLAAPERMNLRVVGMALTFTVYGAAGFALIGHALYGIIR